SAGRSRVMSCAPASVGATLRVVRASSGTPKCSSNPLIAWLSAEVDTPSRFAARVKLRSSATTSNADSTLSSSRTICELYSQTLIDSSIYTTALRSATLISKASSEALTTEFIAEQGGQYGHQAHRIPAVRQRTGGVVYRRRSHRPPVRHERAGARRRRQR